MLNVRMFLNKFYIAFSIPLGAPVDECFTAAVTAQSCVQSVVWMPTLKQSYLALMQLKAVTTCRDHSVGPEVVYTPFTYPFL